MYYTYLVRCSDDTLYCGFAADVESRVAVHNSGKGAKYTRSRRPVELVYFEEFETKVEAQRRERVIKKLTRAEKLRIIEAAARQGRPCTAACRRLQPRSK